MRRGRIGSGGKLAAAGQGGVVGPQRIGGQPQVGEGVPQSVVVVGQSPAHRGVGGSGIDHLLEDVVPLLELTTSVLSPPGRGREDAEAVVAVGEILPACGVVGAFRGELGSDVEGGPIPGEGIVCPAGCGQQICLLHQGAGEIAPCLGLAGLERQQPLAVGTAGRHGLMAHR